MYTKEQIDAINLAVKRVKDREEYEHSDYKDFASDVSDELSSEIPGLPPIAYEGNACPRAWWEWWQSVPDEFEPIS